MYITEHNSLGVKMNRQQFGKFLSYCDTSLSDEYEIRYMFVRTIVSSKDEPRYRLTLTIVSKLNNVTCDFCHTKITDDSAIDVVAQALAYMQSDDVPIRVREVVDAYIAGFICAGGLV